MATPKLLTVLSTLSKDEWSSFRKSLVIHTRKQSEPFLCFSALSNYKNKLLEPGIDDIIREKIFPKMSSKAFSNILSRLYGWLEEWLATMTFRQDNYAEELALIKAYNQRGLYTIANQKFYKLEKAIKEKRQLDIDQNKALAELYRTMYYSYNSIKQVDEKLFNNCLLYFIHAVKEQALIHLIEISNKTLFKKPKVTVDYKTLVAFTDHEHNSILADLIIETILMTKQQDIAAVIHLADKIESSNLNRSSDLYLILTTVIGRKTGQLWNTNKFSDFKKFIRLYQLRFKAIEEHPYIKLLPVHLFNGVHLIALYGSYEESDKFINLWVNKVHTAYPDSVQKYCTAINEFRHDNYGKLPLLLNGLQFDQAIYKLLSNCMMIIAYFEIGNDDLTQTLINNFKKQLKRNKLKISKVLVDGLENLIKIILHLQDAKFKIRDPIRIEDYDTIYYKSWVMKKIRN